MPADVSRAYVTLLQARGSRKELSEAPIFPIFSPPGALTTSLNAMKSIPSRNVELEAVYTAVSTAERPWPH